MNDNLNKQQRKAMISLIFGIISVLPLTALLLSILLSIVAPWFMYYGATRGQSILILYASWLLINTVPFTLIASIIGGIFGIKGLKSAKRNIAVVGVVLCFIGLIVSVYIAILHIV